MSEMIAPPLVPRKEAMSEAEQIVKEKWPDAIAFFDEGWLIRTPVPCGHLMELRSVHEDCDEFSTESEAWEDAAKSLRGDV